MVTGSRAGEDRGSGGAGAPGVLAYLLGHSPHELARLELQGVLYRGVTRRALADAGIGPGQRVLDVGCGAGDVSLLAAELVGAEGEVVGVDRGAEALELARRRAADAGMAHVRFVQSDVIDFVDRGGFDAVVGRFVLMHQTAPAAALRVACAHLRRGGVVMVVESWMRALLDGPHSFPSSPLYDRVVRWKCAVVGGAGADLDAGARLGRTFVEAGLPAPDTRLEASLEGGPDSLYYRYVAESVRSMLPAAEALGMGGFEALGVGGPEELADRLRDEALASGGALVAWPVVVARARRR